MRRATERERRKRKRENTKETVVSAHDDRRIARSLACSYTRFRARDPGRNGDIGEQTRRGPTDVVEPIDNATADTMSYAREKDEEGKKDETSEKR